MISNNITYLLFVNIFAIFYVSSILFDIYIYIYIFFNSFNFNSFYFSNFSASLPISQPKMVFDYSILGINNPLIFFNIYLKNSF